MAKRILTVATVVMANVISVASCVAVGGAVIAKVLETAKGSDEVKCFKAIVASTLSTTVVGHLIGVVAGNIIKHINK